jgi:uncharacterized membrane protein
MTLIRSLPLMPPLVIFLLGSFAGSLVSSGITAIVVAERDAEGEGWKRT